MYTGYRVTLLLLCTAFVSVGLVVASLGPALPELARQTGKSLEQLGTLFIALFGGGLLAQSLSGILADRFGRRIVLVIAAAMFGISALVMSLSTRLPLLLVFASTMGLGYGGISLSVNVLSSEIAPERRASTVNFTNVFFGAGAIAGPLLAGLALEWWGTPIPALQAGAALALIVSPAAAFVDMPASAVRGSHGSRKTAASDANAIEASTMSGVTSPAASAAAVVSSAFVWSCAIIVMLYAGTEASVGSWTPVYLERTTRLDAVQAAAITSAFWAALCAGRIVAAVAGLRLSADRLLSVSFVSAAAGAAFVLAGHGFVWPTVIGLTVLGFAFGPIYPTMMAVVTAASPRAAGAAASRIGVLASIGGMILPSLHGFLIARIGTFTSAAVTAVIVMTMFLGWMAIRRRFGAHF
jgi:MFS transporter, FHS family, L-fucose permease